MGSECRAISVSALGYSQYRRETQFRLQPRECDAVLAATGVWARGHGWSCPQLWMVVDYGGSLYCLQDAEEEGVWLKCPCQGRNLK